MDSHKSRFNFRFKFWIARSSKKYNACADSKKEKFVKDFVAAWNKSNESGQVLRIDKSEL